MTKLEQFLSEFSALEEQDIRFEYLIELAGRFRPVEPRIASRPFAAEHRVPGCESEAYVWAENCDLEPGAAVNRLKFYFAVENPQGVSAKALAVILDENLSGQPLDEVRAADPNLVYTLFGRGLTMGKGQGLMGMVQMVKSLAEKSVC